ncbi:MAG: Nramp family divalent metal transporter [Carbonactinosporaceae bacterium]
MPIRPLPDAPGTIHIIGPAMVLVALGVGLGETYMWPRLVVLFGPEIRWLFLIGVTLQAVVMLEMSRYAMATGESIFFGAARVFKPLMWFFFVVALVTYIWPGHVSGGALALESVTGIPWTVSAIVGLLAIGVVFTFAKVVYNLLENLLSVLIGVLVVGSAIVAAMVGNLSFLVDTLTGMFAFGYIPAEAHTAAWFPIIVGSIAFAGPSGMQQMWYTLYLRDKGAGMGVYLPKIRGLTHAGEEETMPSRGFMFDTENPDEMKKWQGWRRWVWNDAILLFWGITMLVTIIYTVLAQTAADRNPQVADLLRQGEEDAALTAMSDAFAAAGGPVLGTFFLGFIALVAWKSSLGLFDAFSRGQADITYFFIPGAKKFKMTHIYFMFLWGVIAFGILIILFGPLDGPTAILDTLAFLSAFAMGAYCILLLLANNLLLPRKIRPNIVINVLIGFGAVFYLGALFYSLIQFGALPD